MTIRKCRACGGWHDISEPWPRACYGHFGHIPERSGFPSPHFISDQIDEMKSMADGKLYHSKSALRASYRAENNPHGVNFIEVGNEDLTKFEKPKRDRAADRDAIDRAIADVEAGRVPPVLTTDQHPI